MPDPNFYIESPRLFLSYLIADNPKHCQLITDLYSSPSFVATEGRTGVDTPADAYKFINGRSNALLARLGYGMYLCSLKTESNKLEDAIPVGAITLIRGDETKEGEVAYTVPDVGFAIVDREMGK